MAAQGIKRSAPEELNLLEDVKAVVLDIEGTTTPLSFVKETLFPYIKENVKSYLETHWESEECQADVKALREQAVKDKEEKVDGLVEIGEGDEKDSVLDSLVKNILWQMDGDRKTTALKQLQGHVWREAYKSGKIQGKIYDDVAPAIREWISEKRKVYVYSSGSVEAQKLLFGYSSSGSLTELFSGNFDTEIGSKREKDSYSKIASEVASNPNEILFITDMANEAAPASEAGLKTCLVVREGNEPLSDDDLQKFNVIESFVELTSAVPAKRVETDQNGDSNSADSSEQAPAEEGAPAGEDEAEVVDDDVEEVGEDDDEEQEADAALADSTEAAD